MAAATAPAAAVARTPADPPNMNHVQSTAAVPLAAAPSNAATGSGSRAPTADLFVQSQSMPLGRDTGCVKVFADRAGVKYFCLRGLLMAAGVPRGNVSDALSRLKAALYEQEGLPMRRHVQRGSDNMREQARDVAPAHGAVLFLQRFATVAEDKSRALALLEEFRGMVNQAVRLPLAVVAQPNDYRILRFMIARRASDKSSVLQVQAAQLQEQISAEEAQKQEQAELLVDIQLIGGMEAAKAGMVQDLSETNARLTGVKRDREECDIERGLVESLVEKYSAFL
ncbi:MAG: hypothetical protein WDW36_008539 [Sanguina aurantia]